MKKLTIAAIAMGVLTFTACSEKKSANHPSTKVEETVVKDSAFQQAASGEYKSADGARSITLNSDFTAKTQGIDKEYFKWELMSKPEGTSSVIFLVRKGIDSDVKDQATIDTEDGSIVVQNETFRKK